MRRASGIRRARNHQIVIWSNGAAVSATRERRCWADRWRMEGRIAALKTPATRIRTASTMSRSSSKKKKQKPMGVRRASVRRCSRQCTSTVSPCRRSDCASGRASSRDAPQSRAIASPGRRAWRRYAAGQAPPDKWRARRTAPRRKFVRTRCDARRKYKRR